MRLLVPRLNLRPLPQLLQRRLGGANKLRAALRVLLGGWAAMGLTYGVCVCNRTDCPSCARVHALELMEMQLLTPHTLPPTLCPGIGTLFETAVA